MTSVWQQAIEYCSVSSDGRTIDADGLSEPRVPRIKDLGFGNMGLLLPSSIIWNATTKVSGTS